jgi:hypothetical protein
VESSCEFSIEPSGSIKCWSGLTSSGLTSSGPTSSGLLSSAQLHRVSYYIKFVL